MADYSGMTVAEILKKKLARIKKAPLDEGFPGWDAIMHLTWEEVEEKSQRGEPGFHTIYKLLKRRRYNKP